MDAGAIDEVDEDGLANIDVSSVALCDAASRGDTAALRLIKEAGGDVNLGDYDRRTALHLAASDGLLAVAKFLIDELNADHSPLDRWKATPLDDAKRQQHPEMVSYLLEQGALRGKVDCSPERICDAAAKGDMSALHDIKDAGGDVDAGDYDKRTAMHLAAAEGLLEMVIFLMDELGANHSPVDRWGGTPLDDALRHNHSRVVELLVRRGAERGTNPLASLDISSTALCNAASKGDIEGLRKIQEAGGDINLPDYDKRTAIHLAASEGILAVVQALVEELSAHVSPVDRWHGTPLDDAERHGHGAVAEYLLSKGATRAIKGGGASSAPPLDMSANAVCSAAFSGSVAALKKIVAGGGSLSGGNFDQRTAMHLAASGGHYDTVAFLLGEGVDPSPRDRWGHTPLDDATRHGHADVGALLLERGLENEILQP